MPGRKKILIVSFQSLLRKFNHSLPSQLARQTGWEIKVLVPPYGKDSRVDADIFPEKESDRFYDILVGKVRLAGNPCLMQFQSHLKWLLKMFRPGIIDLEADPFLFGALDVVRQRNRFSPSSELVLRVGRDYFRRDFLSFQFIKRYMLKRAAAVITRHSAAAHELSKWRYFGRHESIPSAINCDVFRPREVPELRSRLNPEGKTMIGFLPALGKDGSSTRRLIRTLEGLPVKLLFIGNENQEKSYARLARSKGVNAAFVPHASHQEFAQFLNCMDIIVLPSLKWTAAQDDSGLLLKEAMASGVPLVCPNSPTAVEIAGTSGTFFDPNEAGDLRAKISTLIFHEKLRREKGWNGRRIILENYSVDHLMQKNIELYEKVFDPTSMVVS
jgi:glycosyltransferase involved in cell wall biosynthesis